VVLASNCALFNEVFTIFGSFAQVIEIFIQSDEVVVEEGESYKNKIKRHQVVVIFITMNV